MIKTKKLYAVALLLAGVVAGCQCNGPGTKRRNAAIEEEKTLIDFGQVQVDFEHEQTLRIISAGASALNITELRVSAPFGIRDAVPLSIGSGQNLQLTVTFKPTEVGKRELGKLVIVSDDPERPEITITLQGTGIQATAVAMPNPLDFGDVFQGESRSVTLTIHNKGTNELKVTGAAFLPETPSDISGELGPIAQNVPAGGSTSTEITFKPTQIHHEIPGGVKLTLDPLQGGELVVSFKGRGTRSMPQLCWQWQGQGMATCTPIEAAMGNGNLPVQFPALCDRKIYPMDGGTSPCGNTPYELTGQLFVKNDGNVPIKYSMQYTAAVGKNCDGGTITDPDFRYSNAPAAGALSWTDATVSLPPGMSSTPVNVTYRPTAGCTGEAADTSFVFWTRQGDSLAEQQRQPITLNAFFNGQSLLPFAATEDVTFNVQGTEVELPTKPQNLNAVNRGTSAYQVTKVDLYEVLSGTPGDSCKGPDAGFFQPCDHNNQFSDCYHYAWADGGNPNLTGPHTIPFATDGGTGTAAIGQIQFGTAPEHPGPQQKCVYAVIETTDPFHPKIISKIAGTALLQ